MTSIVGLYSNGHLLKFATNTIIDKAASKLAASNLTNEVNRKHEIRLLLDWTSILSQFQN